MAPGGKEGAGDCCAGRLGGRGEAFPCWRRGPWLRVGRAVLYMESLKKEGIEYLPRLGK